MSILVTIQTNMTNRDTALKAIKRRFQKVQHDESRNTVSAVDGSGYNFSFNLNNLSLNVDSSWRKRIEEKLDEAYRAEEIIQAAEDEGRLWEESYNEEKELVIEVEV